MAKIQTIFAAFRLVFGSWHYVLLSLSVFSVFMALAIWMQNIGLLADYFWNGHVTIFQKIWFFFSGLAAFETNFTVASRIMTVLVTALFGINVSVAVFALRRRVALARAHSGSVLGLLIGMLGIGCISCGSFLLASVFGVSASLKFINVLPLHGFEFGVIAVAILILSITLAAQKVSDPLVCKTPVQVRG